LRHRSPPAVLNIPRGLAEYYHVRIALKLYPHRIQRAAQQKSALTLPKRLPRGRPGPPQRLRSNFAEND
jgi:hypothetical protein